MYGENTLTNLRVWIINFRKNKKLIIVHKCWLALFRFLLYSGLTFSKSSWFIHIWHSQCYSRGYNITTSKNLCFPFFPEDFLVFLLYVVHFVDSSSTPNRALLPQATFITFELLSYRFLSLTIYQNIDNPDNISSTANSYVAFIIVW